ncbi:MAG: gamma-glutamyl-gamma-aminobutyrate hydrolase family protein, partial [Planctomycetota bacterium]
MNRTELNYLLLQVRDADDPMRSQEVATFAEALDTDPSRIETWDLLGGEPRQSRLDACHIVLIGGSGDYSAAADDPWLDSAFSAMRQLYEQSKPTFASCWGFQAMARALGGRTITDLDRAELG